MPDVLTKTDVIKTEIPNCIILRHETEKSFPKNSDHLFNTQLYPLCSEAFISQPKNAEMYIAFKFHSAYAPEQRSIEKQLENVPYKTRQEDNYSTYVVKLQGAENIEQGLAALANGAYAFNSSYANQMPKPFLNDKMQEALTLELKACA